MPVIRKITHLVLFLLLCYNMSSSQTQNSLDPSVSMTSYPVRIDPPNWFVGMENTHVELLFHAPKIGTYLCSVSKGIGIKLIETRKLQSENYLLVKIEINNSVPPQQIEFTLRGSLGEFKIPYQLLQKNAKPQAINGQDVIYLLTPDRFANGDPEINNHSDMRDHVNRAETFGRHGGDIQGVINQMDYLENLGVTTLWLNPVYENNMDKYSYHGYSITDHYLVDPRLGNLKTYRQLCDEAHGRGMKIIKDMIFNHIGLNHHWIEDMPDSSWIHHWPQFTRTNYSGVTVTDPHASMVDRKQMLDGWFDESMPDLNQLNEDLMTYLTQQSIWWIEIAGIDGIRMDTYMYQDKDAIATWVDAVQKEYPDFYIVGETWLYSPAQLAFWTKNNLNSSYKSNLPSVSDFGVTWAIERAFIDKKGVWELYQTLSNDFVYQTPHMNKIFVDNHDMERLFGLLNGSVDKFKLAMSFLLTTRGIPQLLYGTEIGMTYGKPDGLVRSDMPGGWESDTTNVFLGKGMSDMEIDILSFMSKILTWRKSKKLFAKNNLTHFIPDKELYIYGRQFEEEAIVTIINNGDTERKIDFERFEELFTGYQKGVEIINQIEIVNFHEILIPANSAYIIDLIP